jgi:D-glucuronyl C5-epimerase C-terminus
VRPPVGVLVWTPAGRRYLQYTFAPAPADAVLNGFLQSLIGLSDYARVSGDRRADALFGAGDAEARAEVPRYDTGAWSLYQPGQEDDLSYHQLVTGFLYAMCRRTHAPVYCDTASRFDTYMKTPPALTLLRASAGSVQFRLSKISRVGIVVTRGTRTVFLTSAQFPYGVHSFSLPALGKGAYAVRLSATDLPGNFSRITGTLTVSR